MAFETTINLSVENTQALKGVKQVDGAINKLVKGVEEFEKIFSEALNVKPKSLNSLELAQKRLAAGIFKSSKLLREQIQLAAELGRAYDNVQVKVVGTELRRLRAAAEAQKLLKGGVDGNQYRVPAGPGGFPNQKALPAAGETSQTATARAFQRSVEAAAREISEASNTFRKATAFTAVEARPEQKTIDRANALTTAINEEIAARNRSTRAASTLVDAFNKVNQASSQTARQKLLPPGVDPNQYATAAGPAGGGALVRRDPRVDSQGINRDLFNFEGFSRIESNLRELLSTADLTAASTTDLAKAIDRISTAALRARALLDQQVGASKNTLSGLRQQSRALQTLRDNAQLGSKEFDEFNAALQRVNRQIRQTSKDADDSFNRTRRRNNRQKRVDNLREKKRRNQDAIGSGIIGGAFPLLFGQGAGASVGGALGGFGGGKAGGNLGFGLSLAGTAIGAQFDALIQGAQDTAKALARPAENFKELNENLRLFDRAAAQSIQAGIELGRVEEANAIIRQRVAQSIGVDGVRSLDELNEAAKTADKAFAELGLQLQAFVAGPLAAFLRALAEGGKEQGTYFKNNERLRKLQGLLDPADREKLDREIFKESFKVDTLFGIPTGVRQGDQDKIAKILDKFEEIIAYLPKPEVDEAKQTPQDKLNQNISKLQDGLKTLNTKQTVLGISDSFLKAEEDRAKAQRDNDKQRADIVRSYEENLASLRESVERRVQQLRLQTIQKENDAINQRVRNQLQALQTQNAAAASDRETAAVRAGTAPEIFAGTESIQQAFAQLKEQQLSLEEEKARLQRETALEVLKITLDGEKFRFDITQRVAKLNLSTARQIEAINLNIETANNIATKYRFDLEMAIAKARLDVVEAEAKLTRLTLVDSAPGSAGVQQVQQLLDAIRDEKLELDNFKQPAPLPLVEAPQLGGVDIAKEVEAVNKLVEANRQLLAVKLQNLELKNKDVLQDTAIQTNNAILESEKGVNAELANRQRIQSEIEESRKLQSEGLNKEQADQLARFRTGQNIRIKLLEKQKTDLEQLRVQFAGNADAVDLIDNSLANVDTTLANVISKGNQTEELIKKQAEGLALVKEIATDIGAQLASGITSALVDAVEGTKSLGEAFQELAADILKAIGEALILAAVTKAIGAVGTATTPGSGLLNLLFPGKKDGGPVNSNQPYIVGEEGPELFIPGVSGSISNNDQFEAARDALSSGNVDGAFNENGEALGAISTAVQRSNSSAISSSFRENNATLSSTSSYMRERAMERESLTNIGDAGSMVVETQVINNVEYATVEQMQIATAASAKRARAQVFADLKNKPATRASIGMR